MSVCDPGQVAAEEAAAAGPRIVGAGEARDADGRNAEDAPHGAKLNVRAEERDGAKVVSTRATYDKCFVAEESYPPPPPPLT